MFARRQSQHRLAQPRLNQEIFQSGVIFQIAFGALAANFIKRRLRNIEMTALDNFRHLPIEESQKQSANMRPVNISIGHDDDFVIAQFLDIKIFAPNARAERRNQRANLIGGKHFVKPRALDIQDFAAQWQDRLIGAIARLFGRTTGTVTLNQKQLGTRRIALLTIGQLAGQAGDIQRALAPGQFTRFARRFTRRGGFDHLIDDDFRFIGMLFKPIIEHIIDHAFDHRAHF